MERVTVSESRNTAKRRSKKRTIATVLLIVLVVIGAWTAHYIRQTIALARTALEIVPTVEADYQAHHFDAMMITLAGIATDARQLKERIGWLTPLDGFPMIGPKVVAAHEIVGALSATTQAASAVKSARRRTDANVGDLLSSASPAEVLLIARAAVVVGGMPERWPGSTDTEAQTVRRIKDALHPWEGLARLAVRDPGGVRSLMKPGHITRYLVLFQDSGELRSTGGFLAAYGFLTFRDGHVSLKIAPNMSKLSRAVTNRPRAPWVLRTYFSAADTSFINANVNPSVPNSARLIEKMYRSVPGHRSINGVLFVDSWLADQVLGVAGPVTVAGQTFNADNLNVKMEYMAEHRNLPSSTRMLFLQDIAQALAKRVRSSPTLQTKLLPVVAQELRDKHILIYSNNSGLENWLVSRNWAGSLGRFPRSNTLLVLNDNYGGLKDNYFLKTHLTVSIHRVKNGRWQETVTTAWTMDGVRDGWMVGTYVGWIECYVPRGAKLVRLKGYHVHGVRQLSPGLDRAAYGTGILIAPRKSASAPPNVRTLTWVFDLPDLSHPKTLHVEIQPGLAGQELTYSAVGGHERTVYERANATIHVQ